MAQPRCPLESCNIGRNKELNVHTAKLSKEQAAKVGYPEGPWPLYRCGYCDGVWQELERDVIRPIGKLSLGTNAFTAYPEPWRLKLARGANVAPRE